MGAALRRWRGAWLLWALAFGCWPPTWAQAVLPVPALTARVIDQTGTLDAAQRQALEDRLAAFEARSGPQIVVLMVPTTAPEDIAAYAFRVADTWKIGRRDVGDGLLLLVAKNDRRARIEVARALEGAVPDLAARQVIDRELVPAFRAGDYAGGLGRAVDALIARLSGEGLPAPVQPASAADRSAGLPDWVLVAGALLPVVITVARWVLGVGLASLLLGAAGAVAGWWAFGWWGAVLTGLGLAMATLLGVAGLLQVVLSSGGSGGGGGGGGGGGRGGGGFSSGGGGSFGGGGASGSW